MRQSIDFIVNIINKYWTPGRKILEVGCGPAFLRRYYGEDYIGSDITDDDYSADLKRDVDIVCDATALTVPDNSIDIIIIKSALYLFPNPERALQECYRVLKNGGKILIFDYNRRTQKTLQKKEGHDNYPCWNQWQLNRIIQSSGFSNSELLVAELRQPSFFKRFYALIKQELIGTWAIVAATKA